MIRIRNRTRDTIIAEQAELANTFASRGRGLLGRIGLPPGGGLIIYPEWSIHMLFMQFSIDVLFVARDDRVVGVRRALAPWVPFAGVAPWRGHYVIELPTGVIDSSATQLNDQLDLAPHPRNGR